MDIEKLKQDLLKEAETLSEDINKYCLTRHCHRCDFHLDNEFCLMNRLFIALCDGYALGSGTNVVVHEIDELIKELFPNFYKHITKQELEP